LKEFLEIIEQFCRYTGNKIDCFTLAMGRVTVLVKDKKLDSDHPTYGVQDAATVVTAARYDSRPHQIYSTL